jgi:hypothetical protein
MSFFNKILEWFGTKATINSYLIQGELGVYKKRSSYSIKGSLNNVFIDLNNIEYDKLGFRVSSGSYHINALTMQRHNGKTYIVPEADKAISYMHISWTEKERATIGNTPKKVFGNLYIAYCAMDSVALLAHIEQIGEAWGITIKSVNDWIKNEVEVYEKPSEFMVTRSEGKDKDKITQISITFDRTKGALKYAITISIRPS